MFVSLSVRDILLIDRLDLTLGPGLCALTGETGAGKSILLDALGLALGARGDSGLVRRGAARATVAAEFDPPRDHPVWSLIDERGLAADGALVLRRVLTADGRSRAFVNDQPVGLAVVREIADQLVEVQGQADRHGLSSPATHRVYLDGFGGLGELTAEVAAAHGRWRAAAKALAAAEAELDEARRDEEYLRHVVAELDALAPAPGEEAKLAAQRGALVQGEKLAEGLQAALADLVEGRGIEERLRSAGRLLTRAAERTGGALDATVEALDRAAVEIAEALAALDLAGRELAPDPERLERLEERLFALRAAARKHQTDVDSLAGLRDRFGETLAALDNRGEALAGLGQAAGKARDAFTAAAKRLSKARAKAAKELDRRVIAELPALKLDNAVFVTRLEPLPSGDSA
ncbi:MAG: AAA family ATPase [Proteobacteria bacterium]|nr:AAA family ATPase [Pseudomonadota bacterium]